VAARPELVALVATVCLAAPALAQQRSLPPVQPRRPAPVQPQQPALPPPPPQPGQARPQQPAPVQPQQTTDQGSYTIAPGDVLDIVVWRNKELSATVTVRPDGFISLPLVNDVKVTGLTPIELQKRIEVALEKTVTTPMVTVMVTKVAGFRVSILGKVRQPGRYDVDAATTVLDVLALAGGPNDYADPSQMYVLRRRPDGGYEEIQAKYASSVSSKGNTNVTVRPGDIVIVP
jgi:polysaccharide export outer membrane protein